MSELEELYQEVIMDHNLKPRNFQRIQNSDRSSDGFNPFCGDSLTLYVNLDGEKIKDIGFQGSGCAISRASASMMTEAVHGKSEKEAEQLFETFHKLLTQKQGDNEPDPDDLGDLELLSGVSKFPTRVKCATLSWHTLRSALKNQGETVKTE
jgi:nitrogen fixation NifU-like protein